MFSINANTMYSIDENGKHSLEVSYSDSDGIDVGAYAEGNKFEDVILDAINQLDEAIAEYDDDQADVDETKSNEDRIAQLEQQIAELKARNEELEQRHAQKMNHKPLINDDLKNFISNFHKNERDLTAGKNKISDFPFPPGWWV